MTVLDTLNFVAFNPLQNNNTIAVRRRKLIAKIDAQIQLAAFDQCLAHCRRLSGLNLPGGRSFQ